MTLLLAAQPSVAQTPADAGSLLRQQEQLEQRAPEQFPQPQAPALEQPQAKPAGGPTVEVKAVRFSGDVALVPVAQLQAQVENAVGEALDFAGLQALADQVTAYLRDQGYLLARAYLPRQDVTEGVIEIAIVEGRLDGSADSGGGWQVRSEDGVRIDPMRLTAIGEAAAPSGSPAREAELERGLLLMNDLPGVQVRSRLEPGSETGTTRVLVDATQGPLLGGNVWADNYGNSSTGEEQLSGALNINDAWGYGDHASIQGTVSDGITLARLGYGAPLGDRGLRLGLGYTDMRYEVTAGAGVASGLEGHSRIARAGVSYPFVRSRKRNLYGNVDYEYKSIVDDSSAGTLRDKRIDALTLNLSGDGLDTWGGGGLNSWSASITGGDLDLSGAPADAAADAATLGTAGHYAKLGWRVSRLQKLSGNFSALARFSGQLANTNLDSSEEFILGGPAGVRAYSVGEGQGDEGWLASAELRYDLPRATSWGAWQLAAFVDTGRIRVHEQPGSVAIATATGKNSYQLSGAGLGVNLSKPGQYSVRLAWAHTLGDNDGRSPTGLDADGESDDARFWLQGVLWF